jgi:YVTN family beta-propeller protein
LKQNPNDLLLSPEGTSVFVSCGEALGSVEIFVLSKKKKRATINVGHTPQGMVLSNDGKTLYVANRFSNTISVIDLLTNKVVATIPAVREPRTVCITPDGKTVAAANFLPAQAATADVVASEITLIETATNRVRSNVCLNTGSQSVLGLTVSPDGKYLYVVHLLSRFSVPITQLDRGWVNTNALSIIDLKDDSLYATVLLDDVDYGAANPSGIGIGKDNKLYIALSGTHELMSLDLPSLHKNLAGFFSGEIKHAFIHDKEDLSTSLSFTSPIKKRVALKGRLPQRVAFSKDAVLISSRFSTFIEEVSLSGNLSPTVISLGNEPAPDAVRRGELAFNDASICYLCLPCVNCYVLLYER